jgi:hypothetical protein
VCRSSRTSTWKQTNRIDAPSKQVDKADKAKTKADDTRAQRTTTQGCTEEERLRRRGGRQGSGKGAAARPRPDKKDKALNDELLASRDELRPMYLLITGVVLVLAPFYTAPMSARRARHSGRSPA